MTWPTTVASASSGGVGAAADFNSHRDALKAIGDPWATYTPTWGATGTAPSLGNGSIVGAYILAGKVVLAWRVVLTAGSSTTFGTGTFTFTPPFNPSTAYPLHSPIGRGSLFDTSANNVYSRTAVILTSAGSGTFCLRDESSATVGATTPVTVASGDRVVVIGSPYEIA